MFKGTIFEIEVWGEDGNINMVTHAKLEIIIHNYALVYIIILRDYFRFVGKVFFIVRFHITLIRVKTPYSVQTSALKYGYIYY